MAETRGILRLYRRLTSCAFSSLEEMSYETPSSLDIVVREQEIKEYKNKKNKSKENDNNKLHIRQEIGRFIKTHSDIFSVKEAKAELQKYFGTDKTDKLDVEELEEYLGILQELAESKNIKDKRRVA